MGNGIIDKLNLDELRGEFLKYTRRAFVMLPVMDKPHILDIGCGTGIPTLELAELSDGEITGIDIDGAALNKFKVKIKKKGLSNRINVLKCSIYKNSLPDEKFDLLWDEGVMHILDPKKSAKECFRLLKPGGYLVLGETIDWLKKEVSAFINTGFILKNRLFLPAECWWNEYYKPLEKRIRALKDQSTDSRFLFRLRRYEREIKMVRNNPREFDCAFFILQKEIK